jgi:hypothetical protein
MTRGNVWVKESLEDDANNPRQQLVGVTQQL